MIHLLDVNVLIAMVDPLHGFHAAAHRWFEAENGRHWATCPITENGLLRVIGQPSYPGAFGSPAAVAPLIRRMRSMPGHVFWPDAISLLDSGLVRADRLMTSGQITDTYLLALAVANGGRLATFDRRMSTSAVTGGAAALEVIAA